MPRAHPPAALSRDTDDASERLQIALWRRMSPFARLRSAAGASMAAIELCLAGIRRRDPRADDAARFLTFARIRLGADLAAHVYDGAGVFEPQQRHGMELLDLALSVAGAMSRCGLRYVLGGSLASSFSGEPRSTLDIDFMVEISEEDVRGLIASLGPEFHADADSFVRAIRSRSSVNVIHLPTATKIDFFVMGATPLEREQMDRRVRIEIPDRVGAELYVYTPEDILVQKLRWYRLGHDTSDRQWRDVLGIVAVQGTRLDLVYARRAAAQLGLSDLLERALARAPRAE